MNVPVWRLEWLAGRLLARGAKGRAVSKLTRGDLRRLYRAYLVALFGRRRRLASTVKRAGEFGQLVAEMGLEHREL